MTLLDIDQNYRSTNLYVKLQKQPKEWFKKHGIEICEPCHGTGLRANKLKQGGYSWDGVSNCDECFGVGYLNIRRGMSFDDDEKYICPNCQSVGCSECEGNGFVDWIRNIMTKGD
jgi:DnaJ-class molecular chaperone